MNDTFLKPFFRRHVPLLVCWLGLVASGMHGLASAADEVAIQGVASNPPNIVFAFADDLGCYASCYRQDADRATVNDVIRTPHMDQIASEGMRFANAFVSAPSCTPSRAAIVAAQHFFRNGSHSQLHHPWYGDAPDPWEQVRGFPLMLQDAGYHIGWTYKLHLSESRLGGKRRNYKSAGQRFNSFSQQAMQAENPEQEKQKLFQEVRHNFQSFLSDREPDQPFYYWFNPTNTHRPWVQGSGKVLWGIDPDDLKGKMPGFLPDNDIVREDFADYLGEAMAFDGAVEVLRSELERVGEWENTIFVVSGDHGAPGFPRGKCNLYDFGTQVPLLIRFPRRFRVGVCERPVSLIDLGPTFLEAAGLPVDDSMDGQSLVPFLRKIDPAPEEALRDHVIFGRESHVNEARPGGLPYPIRAIRTNRFLFILNFDPDRWPVAAPPLSAPLLHPSQKSRSKNQRRMDLDGGPTRDLFVSYETSQELAKEYRLGFGKRPAEELYDLRRDPDQMNNLADSAEYRSDRDRLRKQLMDALRRGADPRVLDDAFDRPPYCEGNPQLGIPDIGSSQE